MEQVPVHAAPFDEFAEVLKQLTEAVDILTQMEVQKAHAAANSQHNLIAGFLNPEQAQILKLRGLEQKRTRLAQTRGWEGLTFRQILEQPENSQKECLSPLFAQLEAGVKRLTDTRTSADRVIKLRLRELEAAIAGKEGSSCPGDGNAPAPSRFKDRYV